MGAKVQVIRSINGRYKIDRQREVKKSIGNGQAKELICRTHGHDLSGRGNADESGVQVKGRKGEKKMGQL